MTAFLETLADIERKYDDLEREMADPAVATDPQRLLEIGRERSELEAVVSAYRELRATDNAIAETSALVSDPEMAELAADELQTLETQRETLLGRIRTLLIPRDPNDEKDVIVEIRAGTGGDEAALFAADLFRMYTRYAERNRWKTEVMSATETDGGGFREIIFEVRGKGAYSHLRYESGVHRVQRVPVTEAAGRIHTSAVTVAVLPEADEVEVKIDERDLRIDVFRSSGPGGQSVNTTDSAVRITHVPTGIVVSCQDEKSQHKNKAKGLKILRARLFERAAEEQRSQIAASRRSMVGTGDRSERIRTYNFREGRLTDHRIGLTLYTLDRIMEGELDPVIDTLTTHYQAEALQAERSEPAAGAERRGDATQ
jgi:peptide chain release factor 1